MKAVGVMSAQVQDLLACRAHMSPRGDEENNDDTGAANYCRRDARQAEFVGAIAKEE